MPITQQRLLNTLQAGETFRDRYYALREQINHTCARYQLRQMTAEAAMAAISADLTVVPPYMPADAVLREERVRYQYTSARNEIEKRRMRRVRLEAGIEPRKNIRQIRHEPPGYQPPATETIQRVLDANTAEDAAIDNWLDETNASPDDIAKYERVMGKKWKED